MARARERTADADDTRSVLMRRALPRYVSVQVTLLGFSIVLLVLARRNARPDIEFFLDSLEWVWGLNLVSFGLITFFSVKAGWTRRLVSTLVLDFGSSLGSIFLLAITRSRHVQPRLLLFGFMVAAVLAIKAAVLARFAAANEGHGSLRWHRAWIAAVGTSVLVASTGWTSKVSWPDGDGPTYFLVAKSLVSDGDFDLRNNFLRQDYLEFFPKEVGGRIFGYPLAARERDTKLAIAEQRHTVSGLHGAELSWHDIGLPLVLVPGYLLAGRIGALITLNLVAAAAAFAVFELALLFGGIASAIYTWALFLFSAPTIAFAGEAFPEMLGAAVVTWAAVRAIEWDRRGGTSTLFGAGVLIAILPWVCVRYWVLAGGLTLAILVAAFRKPRADLVRTVLLLGAPGALSLTLFAWFDRLTFGTLLPNAGYFAVVSDQPQFFKRPDIGLSGLLFDRAYGLLPIAPFYVAAVALFALMRRWKPVAFLIFPFSCSLVFMSFSQFWYGGWTPPARYLVASLGLIAPACASVFDVPRSRRWLWALGAWSWSIGICYIAVPLARYPSTLSSSRSGWEELAREAGVDVSRLLPTMLDSSNLEIGRLAACIALAALGAAASVRVVGSRLCPRAETLAK